MAAATKAKSSPQVEVGATFDGVPRLRDEVLRSGQYMGACAVQAPGGWLRVGPTWRTPVGWIVLGPGVASWGTTAGLAELTHETSASPTWHSVGVCCAPTPNLVFFVEPAALDGAKFAAVAALARSAQEWWDARRA